MRQYKKPVLESVKLLVKEDIALQRTNANIDYNSSNKITTYKTTEDAVAVDSWESENS